MAVGYAELAFVHRQVTNFYEGGNVEFAMKVMVQFGGLARLLEVEGELNKEDLEARNHLANLYYIWWKEEGDVPSRDHAINIWEELIHEPGELEVHSAYMLAYMAFADRSTPPDKIRLRVTQLRAAYDHITADVDRAKQFTALSKRLVEQYFRRCNS